MATSEDETTQLDDEPLDIETPGDGEVADAASRLDASAVSCPFPFHRLSVPLWGQRAALYPCAADAIPCSLVRSLAESPAGAAAVLLVSWLVYIALWVPFALTQFAFTEAGAWLLLFTALQRVCAVATRFIAYPASFVSVRAKARRSPVSENSAGVPRNTHWTIWVAFSRMTWGHWDLPFGNGTYKSRGGAGAEILDFQCFWPWVATWDPRKVKTICLKTLSFIVT